MPSYHDECEPEVFPNPEPDPGEQDNEPACMVGCVIVLLAVAAFAALAAWGALGGGQ
jgi:hypothetical protein